MQNRFGKRTAAALATLLMMSALGATALAASNPADDVTAYGYNAGQQAAAGRQAEYAAQPAETESDDSFSFHIGAQRSAARKTAFAALPEDATEEQAVEFFAQYGMGEGSAYEDGTLNETAEQGYSYRQGQASYQLRHTAQQG